MKNLSLIIERCRGLRPVITAATLFGAVFFSALEVKAYEPAFTLEIWGDPNTPTFRVTNDSRDRITHIELTVGDFDKHFDMAERKDTYKCDFGYPMLAAGSPWTFGLDIDDDDDGNHVEDYRTVMFNNGVDKPNAVLTVTTLQGSDYVTASLTLPDGAADESYYKFLSESRPRTLKIASRTELADASPVYVARCTVVRNQSHIIENIGNETTVTSLFDGDSVEISAPEMVYFDAPDQYLTDSSKDNNESLIRDNATERFVGLGISVNDVPQTGDPTLYRYTVDGNSRVVVKWRQDFALRMENDFTDTISQLKDSEDNPWAGPLESEAVGNPEPEVKMHWIARGETVIAQVDGQVLDSSHPGLSIRYVPVAYKATGAAGADDDFTVGQSPPSRQQIPEFTMNSEASLTYVWQIQYGVSISMDALEHSMLPIVRKYTGSEYKIESTGEGTFWFNPGDNIQVLCSQNESTPTSLALSGWMNGDGYYLAMQGQIDTTDGSLDDTASVPNGTWINSVSVTDSENVTRLYRGLQISGVGLQRPVRTMWQYGNQAVNVTVPIGQYVFQDPVTVGTKTYNGATFLTEPEVVTKITVTGSMQEVSDAEMVVWDPVTAKLYPVVPGMFRATWPSPDVEDRDIDVLVTAVYPDEAHYPHITSSPAVNLDPDPDDNFVFEAIKYNETRASVDSSSSFESDNPGHVVLQFKEIGSGGRGVPLEYVRIRVVQSYEWNDTAVLAPPATAVIGRKITDDLDLAELGTGYLVFWGARYNPFIYDASKLISIDPAAVYDMTLLTSTTQEKKVIYPENLPGPIIPVNLHPGATEAEKLVVAWYDDPAKNDGLLWPHATRVYNPRWPAGPEEGLGRIVIASQYGSESIGNDLLDQVVVPAITNVVPDGVGGTTLNIAPMETTYNPTRIQQPVVYSQPDPTVPGYNPNEEHGLMAPSLRYAAVSPRPPAVYALRNNDLNLYNKLSSTESGQPDDYTSHPYVLTQFYDAEAEEFLMRVYTVVASVPEIEGYTFANAALWDGKIPTALRLFNEPHVVMVAGEPVIPFYPLAEVIGAVPPPEAFGKNITSQLTYWEDHKNTSWSVSGGSDAWFAVSPYYPLLPDFWWEDGKPGRIVTDDNNVRITAVPNVGDSLAFLPHDIDEFENYAVGSEVDDVLDSDAAPTEILYKSDWPDVAPVLKAGETLTFSGGEHRADKPTTTTLDENNELITVETPGLPGVLAFATAEIVYDSLNPQGEDAKWVTRWTARVGQVLEKRTTPLSTGSFPGALAPASGRTRVSDNKYIFTELPASLQKRFRYDPLNEKLEIYGLVNDKDIGDDTLTAAPPAVYVLEPNILTDADVEELKALDDDSAWQNAVDALQVATKNPNDIDVVGDYLVGLEQKIVRNSQTGEPLYEDPDAVPPVIQRDSGKAAPLRGFGPGLAVIPNADFLDPNADYPDVSWITLVENNDPSMGGSPVTPHIIKVDRTERYRGAIKTVLSDNVFDENIVLRHQGDFGANADKLVFEWWYRPDDGSLNVPPPDLIPAGQTNPWKIFPDLSGQQGAGRFEVMLKGNPNAPEALLSDTWWYCRYRHENDVVDGIDWGEGDDRVNFTWAGAGNSDPFHDYDLNGIMDYQAQLAMGWIKRVLDAVNPYEARINDFEGDNPATVTSMLQQLGPRFEGAVALNPDKNVIENVGLIELYQTILNRGKSLSIDLSRPISTPAIANALQLASTRLSDFYMLLGNEAYSDAVDPTIGYDGGTLAPSVFTFQNQLYSLMDEELGLLHGLDDYFARPVYNRLFWNFTKGEGEAAYVMNYNISDINMDGFIDEDDAMTLYPQGHGDAWGHYLTAAKMQYNLLRHRYFNWVSRSEYYNLMDVVMKVDFLDERKFSQIAAAKAKAGAEILDLTYRENFVKDMNAQWQGYRDSNPDRAWGVEGWARRAGQGAYFDWVTANALLPSEHPNKELDGIQKVDRSHNPDIYTVSANLNKVQRVFDQANSGYNPLGLAKDAIVFDIDPNFLEVGSSIQGELHFDQIYNRASALMENLQTAWSSANEAQNRVREVAKTEAEYRNSVYQEDISYRNRLIAIFGKPYEGTIGSGKLYPAGYNGADLVLHMYVNVREINDDTVPGPSISFAKFNSSGQLIENGDTKELYDAFEEDDYGNRATSLDNDWRKLYAASFAGDSDGDSDMEARDGLYSVNYTDLDDPKVALDGFTTLMPVTTKGYTYQAPDSWGNRLATGSLQQLLSQMIQQEANVAEAIAAWDALAGEILRELRIIDARIATGSEIYDRNAAFARSKYIISNIVKGIVLARKSLKSGGNAAVMSLEAARLAIPYTLPTIGFSNSPGDAMSTMRGAFYSMEIPLQTGFDYGGIALDALQLIEEAAFEIAGEEVSLANTRAQSELNKKEWLKELEDLVGDEPKLRVAIFKEMEALRSLSDQYRSMLDEGARLIDEREAFNRRVAAATQLGRYQDMTFRVNRNHALQSYRSSFDLTARYVYLAAQAYDYETCLDDSHSASPQLAKKLIIKARDIGSLSGQLSWLKTNFDDLRGQIGANNPQNEVGKMSLRTENYRIYPKDSLQGTHPEGAGESGSPANELWKAQLRSMWVDNLWEVPEFRQHCRPFDTVPEDGVEPGLVIRFSSDIKAGENFFGRMLSGGDHSYDPSVFATKIHSLGVWFSDYQSESMDTDLAEAPRVYLLPVGMDMLNISTCGDPTLTKLWNVFEQRIPTAKPVVVDELDQTDWVPIYDSLNGVYGEERRFSSFRAYHDGSDLINEDELVYNSRLVGRSVRNTEWVLIIPGRTLNADPVEGLNRFIDQVSDIKLVFETYGYSGL